MNFFFDYIFLIKSGAKFKQYWMTHFWLKKFFFAELKLVLQILLKMLSYLKDLRTSNLEEF